MPIQPQKAQGQTSPQAPPNYYLSYQSPENNQQAAPTVNIDPNQLVAAMGTLSVADMSRQPKAPLLSHLNNYAPQQMQYPPPTHPNSYASPTHGQPYPLPYGQGQGQLPINTQPPQYSNILTMNSPLDLTYPSTQAQYNGNPQTQSVGRVVQNVSGVGQGQTTTSPAPQHTNNPAQHHYQHPGAGVPNPNIQQNQYASPAGSAVNPQSPTPSTPFASVPNTPVTTVYSIASPHPNIVQVAKRQDQAPPYNYPPQQSHAGHVVSPITPSGQGYQPANVTTYASGPHHASPSQITQNNVASHNNIQAATLIQQSQQNPNTVQYAPSEGVNSALQGMQPVQPEGQQQNVQHHQPQYQTQFRHTPYETQQAQIQQNQQPLPSSPQAQGSTRQIQQPVQQAQQFQRSHQVQPKSQYQPQHQNQYQNQQQGQQQLQYQSQQQQRQAQNQSQQCAQYPPNLQQQPMPQQLSQFQSQPQYQTQQQHYQQQIHPNISPPPQYQPQHQQPQQPHPQQNAQSTIPHPAQQPYIPLLIQPVQRQYSSQTLQQPYQPQLANAQFMPNSHMPRQAPTHANTGSAQSKPAPKFSNDPMAATTSFLGKSYKSTTKFLGTKKGMKYAAGGAGVLLAGILGAEVIDGLGDSGDVSVDGGSGGIDTGGYDASGGYDATGGGGYDVGESYGVGEAQNMADATALADAQTLANQNQLMSLNDMNNQAMVQGGILMSEAAGNSYSYI